MQLNKTFRLRSQAGDTIVEVLISVAILAVVMAATYISSSQSLRNGTDSSNRQQALALANQQVELLKANPVCSKPTPPPAPGYCNSTFSINGAGIAGSGTYRPNNTVFTIADTYSSPTYTITATWPGPSSQNSQLQIYYRNN